MLICLVKQQLSLSISFIPFLSPTKQKACLNGHYDIVKLLIESNANVHRLDAYGQNALHYAVRGNNEKICKLICAKKAGHEKTSRITHMIPRDYALVTVPQKLDNLFDNYQEPEYVSRLESMKLGEESDRLKDPVNPVDRTLKENRIYNMMLRYRDGKLSDPEPDSDTEHGIIPRKKSGKKKKGKKGKKGKKKGKKKK